ncbi:MAG TPA: sigma-70 family RNA polymerase sigma factor [Candidatus Limnocylindria bacterium]|nr:sigma-70 family RNA polymerase sigma factor [Candidatus Limnocylindria bacterium]
MSDPISSAGENSQVGAVFEPTEWSVILATRRGDSQRRVALERLCRSYWLPVYAYLRRRGYSPPDSEDFTQGFFIHLIESDFFDRPDPGKGRFRGYLLGALKHFLSAHFERENALKRGGGVQFVDWNTLDPEKELGALDVTQTDPADAFETGWALALLGRALKRLEEEQLAQGKKIQFETLKSYLSSKPERGDYDRAAQELGTTRTNVAVWVHRLSHRYAELVKLEVASTLDEGVDVGEELRAVVRSLNR